MKIRFAVTALVLAAAPAFADDPPAPPAPGGAAAPTAPAAAEKHVNKVTDAAKAAFDKWDKIANCPVRQGLREAAGTIGSEMMGMPTAMKFTFTGPSTVKVEPDPELSQGPMAQVEPQIRRGAEQTLRMVLGLYRPLDTDEFDADVVKTDGKDVLKVTKFKEGKESSRAEYTLDANGLPSTVVNAMQVTRGGQTQEMKSESTWSWEKAGARWRLSKLETNTGGGGRPGPGSGMGGGGMGGGGMGPIIITPTWTEIGDYAIATSWKTEITGMGMTTESTISDLTVNGKKVEVKKPEEPAKPEGGTDAAKPEGTDAK